MTADIGTLFWFANILAIVYFLVANTSYILFMLFSFLQVKRSRDRGSLYQLEGLFETDLYRSASILSTAYNEELSIVETTRVLLNLDFPDHEVIVINDGSTDQTLPKLIEEFRLKKVDRHVPEHIETKPIRQIYTSPSYPNLVVVDKVNGRKADALNAGINVSRKDLIFAVDADSILENDVLKKMLIAFTEDETTVAVGGVIRVANGCRFKHGRVQEVHLPDRWITRVQSVEYLRAFLFGRIGWGYIDSLIIISGAFGVFDRQTVIDVGGYLHDTIGEDMELVVRIHRYFRDRKVPYKIRFMPEPVCWTEVPEDLGSLGRQRNRWQRGLADTLWRHRDMMFNRTYGRLGWFAMPYFALYELLSPVIEIVGLILTVVAWAMGWISWGYFALFMASTLLLGIILSTLAVLLEELTMQRYKRTRDVLKLIAYAFVEQIGYRQLHLWWRFKGLIDFLKGDKSWGKMVRTSSFGKEESS
ncbi:MAG: glycosyltransferase family 2 protein [Bacteroidota bacterium]